MDILNTVSQLFANPYITHTLVFVGGWLSLKQPGLIAALWAKVMQVDSVVQQAEAMIKTLDAMLKMNGLIPADTPVPPVADVQAVVTGDVTVPVAMAKMKAAKAAAKKAS